MDTRLVRSHRIFGYEIARIPNPADAGSELSIIRTGDSPVSGLDVVPTHTLLEVGQDEVARRLAAEIEQAVARARFFGLPEEIISATITARATGSG
jgi:hypothetical protein